MKIVRILLLIFDYYVSDVQIEKYDFISKMDLEKFTQLLNSLNGRKTLVNYPVCHLLQLPELRIVSQGKLFWL